mgnify:CR=1 FL=1
MARSGTESAATGDQDGAKQLLEEALEISQRIGDRRVVLIGEATHGTSEFYRMRARITRKLIEEKGFTIVALEADWPEGQDVILMSYLMSGVPDHTRRCRERESRLRVSGAGGARGRRPLLQRHGHLRGRLHRPRDR